MGTVIYGREAAADLIESARARVAALRERGIAPRLAVLRAGARGEDLAYERGIRRTFGDIGIDVLSVEMSEAPSVEEVEAAIASLNADSSVHGVLVMRPLPSAAAEAAVRERLSPDKDVDGVTEGSLALAYSGLGRGSLPCTALAALLLARSLGSLSGKRAVVVGRSLVIGKPIAMLLLKENATVTVCHTGTRGLPAICSEADIIIAAAGRPGLITPECVRAGQWVIDVGTTYTEAGLTGDVLTAEVADIAEYVTAVPGGVGAVTRAVLADALINKCMGGSK